MFKNLIERLKHHVVPTEKNSSVPHLLSLEAMGLVLALVLASQAFLFSGSLRSVLSDALTSVSNFASVLPSVLAVEANDYRIGSKVQPLRENVLLDAAARMKADDMARRSYFSHNGPEGEKPWSWLRKAGYSYSHAGENLAMDFSESRDVTEAWINSPTHRANLINANFTEIGIATAEGMFEGRPTTFVVQFFGSPAESQSVEKIRRSVPMTENSSSTAKTKAVPLPIAVARGPAIGTTTATSAHFVTTSSLNLVSVAASSSSSSLKEEGMILGAETVERTETAEARSVIPNLSWSQRLYASIFLSPRQAVMSILGLLSLAFVVIVLMSLSHVASRHESALWPEKMAHAFRVHRKLLLRTALLVVVLLGVAAIDSLALSKPVQISLSWGASAEGR